jgi:signal transduction histidine kinase
MGLINLDEYVTRNGAKIKNTYISLGPNTLELNKEFNKDISGNTLYKLIGRFAIWHNKEARNQGLMPYTGAPIIVRVHEDKITGNIYEILYNQLKILFKNTIDDTTDISGN